MPFNVPDFVMVSVSVVPHAWLTVNNELVAMSFKLVVIPEELAASEPEEIVAAMSVVTPLVAAELLF